MPKLKAELSGEVMPAGLEKKLGTAASVFIYEADKMTPEGRKQIATWLRRQANWLMKHGHDYAPRFRARYMYPKEDEATSTQPTKPAAAG